MATDPADAASMTWTPAICSPLYSSYRVDGLARRSYSNAKQRALHFNSRNGIYGISHQSALIPANFTTLAHFSVSSAISLPNSADDPSSATPPRSPRRAFILGSSRARLSSWLSLSASSAGVFLGTPKPYHWLAS